MKVRHAGQSDDKIELQMTPMIDIVFQLLVFFIMSFKVVVQEGDFNIKMPLAAPSAGLPDDNLVPPLRLRLVADSNGNIANISLNDSDVSSFDKLRSDIIGFVGDDRGPGSIQQTTEVEVNADYRLRYEEVVKAITAISGYIDDRGNVQKLVEKIKFKPQPAGSG